MIYPPATSFIPISVALARYIEAYGFGGNYPFWYLGTTSVKYLIGPLAPSLLMGFHKLLPSLSLFDISLILVLLSWIGSALGWGMLAFQLSKDRKLAILAGVLVLILPWHIVWDLAFGEVSAVLAAALTPWALFAYARISSYKFSIFNLWVPSITFLILLLTNSTASIPTLVGLVVLGIVKGKHWDRGLKQVSIVVFLGWFLSLFWYGFGYWLTVWGNPSLGGRSTLRAFVWLFGLLRQFVPVLIAIFILSFKVKKQTVFEKFIYYWLGSFGLLTLFRFMADPKFWLDWAAWISEVEIGVVLLVVMLIFRSVYHFKKPFDQALTEVGGDDAGLTYVSARHQIRGKSNHAIRRFLSRKLSIFYLLFAIYFLGGWSIAFVNRELWLPRESINNRVEYKIAKVLELETGPASSFLLSFAKATENKFASKDSAAVPLEAKRSGVGNPSTAVTRFDGSPRVFLSGTTAFWLNSLVDVKQVRGGRDEASVDPNWRQAVWEVREGLDPQLSYYALKKINVVYVVVHASNSQEYWHDFKFPNKFENFGGFQKIYDSEGDFIYQLKP